MPLTESKKNILVGIFIFLLALALRLSYLFFLQHHYIFYNDPASDVLYYQEWAKEIARGDWIGHKVFLGMPLYPYFLAALYRLTLGNLFLLRLAHLILGSGNCVLVYLIARYTFSRRIAFIAAVFMATNFMMIYYDGLLMPVVLIVTLSLLIVWALLKMDQHSSLREWFFLGLLIGLSILSDGKFLIFFILFLIILFIRYHRTMQIYKIFLPLVLAVGMILFSVALRNRVVSGDWILVSAQSGFSFFVGNNPQANGIFENLDFIRPTHAGQDEDQQIRAEQILKRKLKPGEVSRFWMNQALRFIKESPVKYLSLLQDKLYFFFLEHEWAHDIDLLLQKEWKQRFDINSFSLICPFAFLGILLTFRAHPSLVFVNLFIVSQLLFTMMFFLTTKHRATILPFLMIYEAYTLDWLLRQIIDLFFDPAKSPCPPIYKKGRRADAVGISDWRFGILFSTEKVNKGKKFKRIVAIGGLLILFFMVFRPIEISRNVLDVLRFSRLGDFFQKKGEYEKSKEFYLKASRLNPNDTNLIYNFANTFLLNGQVKEAIEGYRKVLLLNPSQVDALYNLAYAYESLNQLDLACEFYEKVLNLQPQSVDTHYRLANIYSAQGNCSSASAHYLEIAHLIPSLQTQVDTWISACHPH